MCLQMLIKPNKEEKSGIGYKIVRTTDDPNIFTPYYHYFSKYGSGGTDNMNGEDSYRVTEKYTIGEWTQIKHRRKARISHYGEQYRAGIHLFMEIPDFRPYDKSTERETFALIKFEYEQATYHDGKTIVAFKVKPLEVVNYIRYYC